MGCCGIDMLFPWLFPHLQLSTSLRTQIPGGHACCGQEKNVDQYCLDLVFAAAFMCKVPGICSVDWRSRFTCVHTGQAMHVLRSGFPAGTIMHLCSFLCSLTIWPSLRDLFRGLWWCFFLPNGCPSGTWVQSSGGMVVKGMECLGYTRMNNTDVHGGSIAIVFSQGLMIRWD